MTKIQRIQQALILLSDPKCIDCRHFIVKISFITHSYFCKKDIEKKITDSSCICKKFERAENKILKEKLNESRKILKEFGIEES